MSRPRVCVLRAPGTNCDVETAFAFERVGADAERVHLFRLLEQPERLKDFQILCIPGGFSYGDDVGAGVIFGSQLRGRLGEAIHEYLQADKLALGICNGFQVLIKAGILPGGSSAWPPTGGCPEATLTWNDNGRYTARWVHLDTAGSSSVFLRGIESIELPIAHGEGKVVPRDADVLQAWSDNQQIALCYSQPVTKELAAAGARRTTAELTTTLGWPHNPNGSTANIAGLSDPTGRVLGLMPHPERFQFATQHPQWTRRGLSGPDEGAGLQLFRNAVEYFG